MADPTERVDKFGSWQADEKKLSAIIKTSEALKKNALVNYAIATGKLEFAKSGAGLVPTGLVLDQREGDPSKLTGDGSNEAVTRGGIVLENVSVAGVSGVTDVSSFVFASDGQTLTKTKPTTGLPSGIIIRWRSTTYCDVLLFSFVDALLMSLSPRKASYYIGSVNSKLLEGTSALDLLQWTAPSRMLITAFYAVVKNIDTGLAAGAQTINLEIGSTNLTGGVLTLGFADWAAADDLGDKISATAITADNVISEGEVLTAELVAGGTGMTADKAGLVDMYIDATLLPGA